MARWLSSLLVTIMVLALVALAILPNSVVVTVNLENQFNENVHTETTHNDNHTKPAEPLIALPDQQEDPS